MKSRISGKDATYLVMAAMRRRDFIGIVGAAATSGLFPAPAPAEQVRKLREREE
jgi:hypothetical protein